MDLKEGCYVVLLVYVKKYWLMIEKMIIIKFNIFFFVFGWYYMFWVYIIIYWLYNEVYKSYIV